jgi:three-Cys-motif partner protein
MVTDPTSTPLDEIGPWSEVKLAIINDYAKAYTRIVNGKGFHSVYIDAFAGTGVHISKTTDEIVPGSPLNALSVEPPFNEFYFIDINRKKIESLESLSGQRPNVHILEGDCNRRLPVDVFPNVKYEDYRRGLCLLDPYGLHLSWDVIRMAGQMKTIDLFLNFPMADMNRNVLWHEPTKVTECQGLRMSRFWGDESWRQVAQTTKPTLFGDKVEKAENIIIARAFRERLKRVAGFPYVPEPIAMRNSRHAVVYYLFFASPQRVADTIVQDIFDKYGRR